jgi:hypothetical protein
VNAVRDRATFTTAAAESTHPQWMTIEENLVVTQIVIIPNHAQYLNLQLAAHREAARLRGSR